MSLEKSGLIRSVDELVDLNIIDFGRNNGRAFGGPHKAIEVVGCHVVGTMTYSIYRKNHHNYPQRDDFPEWHHVGNHVADAKEYWNQFKYHFPESTLRFSDAPDFSGTLVTKRHVVRFWGDIGRVSPMAFLESIKQMKPGDIWISLQGDVQIVLEAQLSHHLVCQFLVMRMARNLGIGRKKGAPIKDTPESEKDIILWLKEHGYDPDWSDEQYDKACEQYMEANRLRPGVAPLLSGIVQQSQLFQEATS